MYKSEVVAKKNKNERSVVRRLSAVTSCSLQVLTSSRFLSVQYADVLIRLILIYLLSVLLEGIACNGIA